MITRLCKTIKYNKIKIIKIIMLSEQQHLIINTNNTMNFIFCESRDE